jgi:Na+-driven multidrug efflux pump
LDVFLASTLLDPHSVAELVIVQRLFLIYVGLTSILMTPLWASYADAMVNNDHVFIRKTLFRSLYLAGILILVSLLPSFMFSEKIFFYWSQGTFSPDKYLVFLVAVSAAITMINCAFNYYLNGCGIMRPQVVANIISGLLMIIAKIGFCFAFGLYGIVLAGILSMIVANSLTYGLIYRRETFRWVDIERR